MLANFDNLTAAERYAAMSQCLIPRPVAWVLSLNKDKSLNLAPFSYFTAIGSDPALIMLSIGKKADGQSKDTRHNIVERDYFTVQIATAAQAQLVNDSAALLPRGESEVEKLAIKTIKVDNFPVPRIQGCPVSFLCRRHSIHEVGKMGVIYGEIKALWVDDEVTVATESGKLQIDSEKLNPLCRLGGNDFASLGQTFTISKEPL